MSQQRATITALGVTTEYVPLNRMQLGEIDAIEKACGADFGDLNPKSIRTLRAVAWVSLKRRLPQLQLDDEELSALTLDDITPVVVDEETPDPTHPADPATAGEA